MITFCRSARSAAERSGRTLKPTMIASEVLARSTSESVIAPVPVAAPVVSSIEKFKDEYLALIRRGERVGAA